MKYESLDILQERLESLIERMGEGTLARTLFDNKTLPELKRLMSGIEQSNSIHGGIWFNETNLAHEAARIERLLLETTIVSGITLGSKEEPSQDWQRAIHHGLVSKAGVDMYDQLAASFGVSRKEVKLNFLRAAYSAGGR